jgi:hypothetical protein
MDRKLLRSQDEAVTVTATFYSTFVNDVRLDSPDRCLKVNRLFKDLNSDI